MKMEIESYISIISAAYASIRCLCSDKECLQSIVKVAATVTESDNIKKNQNQ